MYKQFSVDLVPSLNEPSFPKSCHDLWISEYTKIWVFSINAVKNTSVSVAHDPFSSIGCMSKYESKSPTNLAARMSVLKNWKQKKIHCVSSKKLIINLS